MDFERQLFMLLRAYGDESYGDKVFALGFVIAPAGKWLVVSRSWKRFFDGEKKRLNVKLERFHAADCYRGDGEFKGISSADRFKIAMQFMKIATSQVSAGVVFCVHLEDLRELYGGPQRHVLKCAYEITMGFVMDYIMEKMEGSSHSISMVFDGEKVNGPMVESYNSLVEDPSRNYRDVFKSITFQSWRNCPPLEAADIVTYYSMKEAVRHSWKHDAELNPIFDRLLNAANFGITMKLIPKSSLRKMICYKHVRLKAV